MTTLYNLFYVSETTTSDAADVLAIADCSQGNNARDAITGLLLFDGRSWCQYIEGPRESVESLFGRLRRDARHRDMRVLQNGRVEGERCFPSWRMGFSYVADPAAIRRVLQAQSGQAFDAFRGIEHAVRGSKYDGTYGAAAPGEKDAADAQSGAGGDDDPRGDDRAAG